MLISKLLISLALSMGLIPATEARLKFVGINVSSGEFGVYSPGNPGFGLPGRFPDDYQFINKSAIDVQISQGINLFRLSFLVERMCPPSYGLGSKFNETHWQLYNEALQYITDKGAYVMTDPHNYMRYGDPSAQPMSGPIIGNTSDPKAATTAQFGAFWGEMARRLQGNPKVIYGLMNEPHDMPTSLVLLNDQAAITSIRKTGATQLIAAPGNSYTGGHSWLQSSQNDEPSANYLNKLRDPINNTAIDIHEYLDYNFSGGNVECVNTFDSTMGPLTEWLRVNGLRAIVSEFGGSNTTVCAEMLKGAVDYVAGHDEYIGLAAWASGPKWNIYSPCCNNYTNNFGSLEPGSKASDGGPSYYDTIWLPTILPAYEKYYSQVVREGVSSIDLGNAKSAGNKGKGKGNDNGKGKGNDNGNGNGKGKTGQ